jgi:bifunctional non-homologous end joining protein LigD
VRTDHDDTATDGSAVEADPLAEYRSKRDFTRTAEPSGGTAGKATTAKEHGDTLGRQLFCIQKHAASSLHYDLRLELDGVLKSWAVPKGPSLDPKDRRLAVMTEDHPLEYGSFEGTIPEGEYGAGTVMLWDTGWWEPDTSWSKDFARQLEEGEAPAVGAAVAAGELKFVLHGEKLKGSWVLVQMKGRGAKNWLLVKHRDEEARPGYEVTSEESDSVATGRTIEEIAFEDDAEHTGGHGT